MAKDPYKYFRVEAQELLEALGQGALALEQGAPPDLVSRLLRVAHTLKGAARAVKRGDIATLAHAAEDALEPLRDGTTAVSRERIDALLKLVDSMKGHVASLDAPASKDGGGMEESAARPAAFDESLHTLRADRAEMDALLEGVAETSVQLESMRPLAGVVERTRRLADLLAAILASAPNGTGRGGLTILRKAQSLGEELRGVAVELQQSFSTGISRVEREIRQVHEMAERLWLLPASVIFGVLERTVRDVSHAQGTRVTFDGRGGDIRLDAHVLGVVQGALLQAVRNAVAHGIEPEAERLAAGKPSGGRVDIAVIRRGNRVAFVCHDDGRGIDLEAVRRIAERKGLLSDPTKRLGSSDLLQLLLKGGVTTAGSVTEVSGRGIGLDVVREAAARLGGQVLATTDTGRGTTLELVVPVSLSSVDVLLLQAGAVTAALPLDGVRQTIRIAPRDVVGTPEGFTILHEGETIPFVRLASCLDRHAPPASEARAWSAVVVEAGSMRAALGVDRLLGTANVVVRPLPAGVPDAEMIAGASFDAEGRPRLVLDPAGLLAALATYPPPPAAEARRPEPVLVIDDSLTTRMLERSVLESAGYEVDLAASALEGLAMARKRRYGLFLLDIEMPDVDGFGFMERTRADPDLRDVPTILVTSLDGEEPRRRGEELGARGYMVKGEFDQSKWLDLIGGFLR